HVRFSRTGFVMRDASPFLPKLQLTCSSTQQIDTNCRSVSISIKFRARGCRSERLYRLQNFVGIGSDHAVPTGTNGLYPLGLFSHGYAWDSEPVSFFLKTTRIGKNHASP